MNFKKMFAKFWGAGPSRNMPSTFKTDHLDVIDVIKDATQDLSAFGSERIGGGSAAQVYTYPVEDQPDLVVRISPSSPSGSDGWIQYAQTLREDARFGAPQYGPYLLALAHRGGVWISVTPKLTPIDTDNDHHLALINAARKIIDPHRWGEASPDDITFIEKTQPGFVEFAEKHLGNASDLGHSNFMMDGDHLIVNDPIGTMDPQFERELLRTYNWAVLRPKPEEPAYLFD